MAVKKFVFCVLFFTNAINSAEKDDSDNKKFSISTVERDSSIPKNNYNTRKWGSIYLLFNPITHFVDYYSEYTWLTFFRIFTGDILYRYISKKGVGVMLKLGFNSSISALNKKNIIRLSPSLTLSFCWVYKKKGKKLFSGSFCPIGMGWYNIFQLKEQQTLQKNDEQDVNKEYSLITNELFQENNNEKNYTNYNFTGNTDFDKKRKFFLLKESVFIFFLTINYLHYENGKCFFLSWGKFAMVYSETLLESIGWNILFSLGHLELGFSLLKSKHRKKNIDL